MVKKNLHIVPKLALDTNRVIHYGTNYSGYTGICRISSEVDVIFVNL